MCLSLRSVSKPSHGVASTCLLNRDRLPAAVLASDVVSFLTDVSSKLPSQAPMSGDWPQIATRTFVGGHSYAQAWFSNETLIRRHRRNLGNIDSCKTTVGGRPLRSVDRNFWGVTFAEDEDTFCATAASGSTTSLMRGSIRKKSMVSLLTDAKCPSLSPDHSRIPAVVR
jgi:hypothetical protein